MFVFNPFSVDFCVWGKIRVPFHSFMCGCPVLQTPFFEETILPTPVFLGFPGGSAGKESACNAGDLGSIPGLGRSSWRREQLSIPVFWPGEFQGLYSPWGHKESDTTEWLSLSLILCLDCPYIWLGPLLKISWLYPWAYFWTLSSASLVYVSLFMLILFCFWL